MSGDTSNRREFVTACTLTLLAPLIGACASLAAHRVPVEGGRIHLRLADHPALGQPGGSLKIQPAGEDDPLYVISQPDGVFVVLSSVCTHRGCTVDIQGARLVCPCHGSTYDNQGKVLRGPAERPLGRYAARVVNGVLDIDLADTQ